MIAPDASLGKRACRNTYALALVRHHCACITVSAHGFVKPIIMQPEFGQAGVNLPCETMHCFLRAWSAFARRIPQPPSPPEPKRTRPKSKRTFNPPML